MAKNEYLQDEEIFNAALSQRTDELYRVPNQTPDDDGCIDTLVLPLLDIVIFPHMVTPVFVAREASLLAMRDAHEHEQTVIGLVQRDPETEEPGPQDFLPIGVEPKIPLREPLPQRISADLISASECSRSSK